MSECLKVSTNLSDRQYGFSKKAIASIRFKNAQEFEGAYGIDILKHIGNIPFTVELQVATTNSIVNAKSIVTNYNNVFGFCNYLKFGYSKTEYICIAFWSLNRKDDLYLTPNLYANKETISNEFIEEIFPDCALYENSAKHIWCASSSACTHINGVQAEIVATLYGNLYNCM